MYFWINKFYFSAGNAFATFQSYNKNEDPDNMNPPNMPPPLPPKKKHSPVRIIDKYEYIILMYSDLFSYKG